MGVSGSWGGPASRLPTPGLLGGRERRACTRVSPSPPPAFIPRRAGQRGGGSVPIKWVPGGGIAWLAVGGGLGGGPRWLFSALGQPGGLWVAVQCLWATLSRPPWLLQPLSMASRSSFPPLAVMTVPGARRGSGSALPGVGCGGSLCCGPNPDPSSPGRGALSGAPWAEDGPGRRVLEERWGSAWGAGGRVGEGGASLHLPPPWAVGPLLPPSPASGAESGTLPCLQRKALGRGMCPFV